MSSTSNVQDLLVNVFRPTYRYEAGTGFVPSLVLSNVSEVITGKLQAGALVVSDSNLNTYIGSNAGTTDITRQTRSNVAIGYAAMGGAFQSSNNASIGFSNFNGLSNANSNVGIGAATLMGRGIKNVLIGPNIVLGDGSGNIVIGSDISLGSVNNRFQLGRLLYGDLSAGKLGVNTTDPQAAFDISGITVFRNKVGFQNPNPDYSLDVNGSVYVSERLLVSSGTQTAPIYSFKDVSGTGFYQATDVSYGTGALGLAVNQSARVVVTSNKTYIYGNLDVCGTLSAAAGGGGGGGGSGTIASNGTAAAPSFTFSNDLSTGLHLGGTSYLAFDTSGVQRMCISGAFVGIGTPTPRVTLDVSGDISANVYNGPGGTQSAPHYTFSDDRTTGLFFPGANIVGLTAGGTERMRISNANIGIGTTAPTNALDVSGTLRVIGTAGDITFTNGTIAIGGNTVVSSTGVLSNGATTSNSIGGVVLSNTDLCMNSAGRILAPILRNALAPTQFDISGGNISNSATTRSSNFIGTASASNSIGGITLSNNTISNAASSSNSIGGITLSNSTISNAASSSNSIGGITLSNNTISNATSSSNSIGGTILSNSTVRIANGVVGAPSLTFAGDASAGVYRPTANAVSFSVAGLQTLNLSNNLIELKPGGTSALWLSNGQAQLMNGSVAAPSLAFAADASSGVYRPNANQVAFVTAGLQRMVVSNANVGIGVASPTQLLDVNGVINTASNFRVGQSNNLVYRSGPAKASAGGSYGVTWGTVVVASSGTGLITYTVDSTNGDSFTVGSNGLYAITLSANQGAYWTVDADLASTSINTVGSAGTSLIAWNTSVSGAVPNGTCFTVWLATGKTYRIKCQGGLGTGTNCPLFIVPVYATA
jgi:hypothetical protein